MTDYRTSVTRPGTPPDRRRRHRDGLALTALVVLFALVISAVVLLLAPTGPDANPARTQPRVSAEQGVGETGPPGPTASQPTPPSIEPRTRIALIGDSLLWIAEAQIEEALADHEVVAIDARAGTRIAEHLETATVLAKSDLDVLVVVLGANDAAPPDFTREAVERDVAALLDATSEMPSVKWVTVQEDFYLDGFEAFSQGTLTLNVTLFREAARRSNLEVIDFAPTINDQPNWHTMDVLHLDEQGSQALTDAVADAVRGGG